MVTDRDVTTASRLARLETAVESIEARLSHVDADREILQSVKRDTEAIVSLYKGGYVLGKIFLWVVMISAGITTVVAFLRAKV